VKPVARHRVLVRDRTSALFATNAAGIALLLADLAAVTEQRRHPWF
jgi:hypothetical protein